MLGKLKQCVSTGSTDSEVAAVWLSPPVSGNPILGVSIFNKGPQPMEVTEVGFLLPDDQKLFALNGLKGGGHLPQVLQPGAQIIVPLDPRILTAPSLIDAQCAYAKTANQQTISGPTLRHGELTGASS